MSKKHLATYLNDHFAGSQAGLEVLDHIEAKHGNGSVGEITRKLRSEFHGERKVIADLLERLDSTPSVPRRVAGWFTEKALELKLYADDPGNGALRLFEASEALKLGVHGKLSLWKALQANALRVPELAQTNYEPLIKQAEEQEALLEMVRIEASSVAFTDGE